MVIRKKHRSSEKGEISPLPNISNMQSRIVGCVFVSSFCYEDYLSSYVMRIPTEYDKETETMDCILTANLGSR